MDFWKRPSVELATFYEIFYEKSTFFLKKKQISAWQGNTLDLHVFFSRFLKPPAGKDGFIFPSIFVAVATSMENGPCTGKYGRLSPYVIFFTIYVLLQRMTSSLP
jgi:hypothetical protein